MLPIVFAGAEPRRPGGVHIALADLPAAFSVRGGIWQQVLAGLTLSRSERAVWHALVASGAGAARWLLCRLAAKDAARLWLSARGHAIPPADIEIDGEISGPMRASGAWVADGGPLELATELVEGSVVAVVRAPVEYALAIK